MKQAIYAFGLATATFTTALSAQDASPVEENDTLELEELTLQSSTEAETIYYSDAPVSTATKLGLSILETPQSISVITQEQLDDFALDNLNAALRYAPGINVESVETDRTYYTARGFDITNFQIDGLGLPLVFGNIAGNLDSAIYEEVQVLRGANGLATGSGNPSATINLIRKRPTAEFQGSIEAVYGSWDKKRVVADISSPLNEAGSIRGRIVSAYQEGESYLDRYSSERSTFYGIVEADLTDRTLFTVGYTYEKGATNSPSWGALPIAYSDGSPTNYDVSTSTSSDWSYWDKSTDTAFARIEQELGDTWNAKAEISYSDQVQESELFYMYGTPDPTTGLGLFSYPSYYDSDVQEVAFNFSVDGKYELFSREHDLVAGYTYGKTDITQLSLYGTGIGTPIAVPLENWTGNYPKPAFIFPGGGSNSYREESLYTSTRLNASDNLKVILGARLSRGSGKGNSYATDRDTEYSNEFVPYAGFIYELNDTLSVFGSYTEIFVPQVEVDAALSTLDPVEGVSYELGLKANLFNNKAYASASIFHVEQDNLAEDTGVDVGAISIFRGADFESEGFEAELVGEIFENLTLSTSYTYLQIKDENGDYTKRYTPKHLFKIAGTYEFGDTGFKVGAAARYKSDTQALGITQDAYVIVDLMAAYEFNKNWSASINVFNAFDEKHYNSLYWDQAIYGAPRSAEVSLKYSF